VGEIGGTVGTAISATFLLLIAIINIIFLRQAIRERKRLQSASPRTAEIDLLGDGGSGDGHLQVHGGGLMVRIIGPVLKTVDRPWKLYPVGVLFGLGPSSCSFPPDLVGSNTTQGSIPPLPLLYWPFRLYPKEVGMVKGSIMLGSSYYL
jgi:high-affinity nickel-transport protein